METSEDESPHDSTDDVASEMTITVPVPDGVQAEVAEVFENNPDTRPDDLLADRFTWDWNADK